MVAGDEFTVNPTDVPLGQSNLNAVAVADTPWENVTVGSVPALMLAELAEMSVPRRTVVR